MIYNKTNLIPIFLILSFAASYLFGEDSLGGAKHDYLFHEKFIKQFSEDFFYTFINYGNGDYYARNSPIFYILFSKIYNLIPNFTFIRYLNFLIIFPLLFLFFKCLKIKFKNLDNQSITLLCSIILLSPTVRSLTVWPYPFIYALTFFLLSIFYFLKFEECNHDETQKKYCYLNILFLSISGYFTPNFAIFSVYFFYLYFLKYNFSKEILKIIVLNFILALPALYYIVFNDFYLFKYETINSGELTQMEKYNLSNKIIIITTILFLYLIPYFSKIRFIKHFKNYKFNFKKFIFILSFFLINVFFFNFEKNNGGGIIYHFSNFILGNNFFLFFVFGIGIFFINILILPKIKNYLLLSLLIIYNLQYTIYLKYFDPIIIILLLFFIKLNPNLTNKLNKTSKGIFVLYLIIYLMSLSKKYLNYI